MVERDGVGRAPIFEYLHMKDLKSQDMRLDLEESDLHVQPTLQEASPPIQVARHVVQESTAQSKATRGSDVVAE